ncbi:MAG: hypothetical protein AMXMBFR84_34350 [Candidatus Hydrogenedentota bacterium]
MVFTESLLMTLLDNLQEGVYFVDTHRTILYWNKGAESLSGYRRQDVVGRCCASNILAHVCAEGHAMCTDVCPLMLSILDGQPRQTEAYLRHCDGHRIPVQIRTSPIRDGNGDIVGAIESFSDNSAVISAFQQVEEFRKDALMCPLTGVANRRFAVQFLEQRVSEWNREGKAFSVLFLDIDHFKSVNDTHGHVYGDAVLRTVATTLRKALRNYDFIARWGGEEFVVVLNHTDPAHVAAAANRMRILVQNSNVPTREGSLSVTVSLGAAIVQPGDNTDTIVRRADELLYESKRLGRNRVTVQPISVGRRFSNAG